MSAKFGDVMRSIGGMLKEVYAAPTAVVIPGSGTYGMEAVARQFANGKRTVVVRNGWFSFRWTQIFEAGKIPASSTVLKARRADPADPQGAFSPAPVEEVVAAIKESQAEVVFAPHVETSAGMVLPDDYIKAVADAAHEAGALFVLDCIASGTVWIDMEKLGVDVLISAPQKGWSGPACCAFVMLSARARQVLDETTSSSFTMDLRKWVTLMETYEKGAHMYHATMPTDALEIVNRVMCETKDYGFEKVREEQIELGSRIRAMMKEKGFKSVAAEGYEARSVVVCYTTDPGFQTGKSFKEEGVQIAAGVPLECDEGPEYRSFRIGLFGLDKLHEVERTVTTLEQTVDKLLQ
uniref:alanine--glyoxylate transaminase n=1 Tax=Eutreptiella gymnastica TaxID=73025 RepID=A0A7S4FW98_9EUGL